MYVFGNLQSYYAIGHMSSSFYDAVSETDSLLKTKQAVLLCRTEHFLSLQTHEHQFV